MLYNLRNAIFHTLCWAAIRVAPSPAMYHRGAVRTYSSGTYTLKEIPRVINQRYLKWPTKHQTPSSRLQSTITRCFAASAATLSGWKHALRRFVIKNAERLVRLTGARLNPGLSALVHSLRKA